VKICVDTTLLSRLVRADARALESLSRWKERHALLATSELNYFEVRVGIEREASPARRSALMAALEVVLSGMELHPLNREATEIAIRRQVELMGKGRPAGLADLLVASIARAGDCDVIATENRRDFDRIGLVKVLDEG
jgi:predicted nucleic acid-binding protein